MEISFLVAFFSGIMSFFAPCVIPMLPAYLGYITGVSIKELKEKSVEEYKSRLWWSSLSYVVGFSFVFVLMGTTAAGFGSLILGNSDWIQRIGGLLVMFFSLTFLGVLKMPWLQVERGFKLPEWSQNLGYGRAFLVGVVFATAWSPCVGAVLGAILSLAAASQTVAKGAWLLFVYSLGISLPFLLVSLILVRSPSVLSLLAKYSVVASKASGILLFVIGFLLFNNTLGLISKDLTYNRLNGWFFEQAIRVGLGEGLVGVFGI